MPPEGSTSASYPFIVNGSSPAIESNFVGAEGGLETRCWVMCGEDLVARCERNGGSEGADVVPTVGTAIDAPYRIGLGRGNESRDGPPAGAGNKPGSRRGFRIEHSQRSIGRRRAMSDRSLHQFMSSTGARVSARNGRRGAEPIAWEAGGAASGAGRGVSVPSGDLVRGSFSAEVHGVGVKVESVVVLVIIGSAGAGKCAEDLCGGFCRGKLGAPK